MGSGADESHAPFIIRFKNTKGGDVMSRYGTMLELDTSDFEAMLNALAQSVTEEQYRRIITRSMTRAARAVRTAVSREITAQYYIPYSRALAAQSAPQISDANMEIYVHGVRERIGPTGPYPAWSQGSHTAQGHKRKRNYSRSAIVTMQDVRGVTSTLPAGVGSDARHFMVMSGKYAGRVFAAIPKSSGGSLFKMHTRGNKLYRYARSNEKVRPAVGIAIPQMPLNRSAPGIQMRFEEIFQSRIQHEWENVMNGIAQSSRRGSG